MFECAGKLARRDREEWTALLRKCGSAALAPFLNAPHETQPGLLHPFHAARGVAEALTPDTAIVTDGGEAPFWFRSFVKSLGPGLTLGNGYLDCLRSRASRLASTSSYPETTAMIGAKEPEIEIAIHYNENIPERK